MKLGSVLIAYVALAAAAVAQIPAKDARNTNIITGSRHFQMPVYATLPEWEARAAHLRKQILASAGLLPLPERTPLHPQIFGRLEREGYTVEKVLLETMPGFFLGGNLYRPAGKPGKFPGVASPHGHWDYGRLENTPPVSVPARCINLARQGYVVFSYDMLGYDDTIQTPHDFGGEREDLWSFNALGLQLWNSMRAIDFLQSLADVDAERIAVTGASGGGTQTFLVSAVDPRVKFAAPVNMISAIMQGGACESAPGLRLGTFNVEIGALMAPRPLLMVSATGDWTKNTPHDEFPAIQSIYKLYGKPELVESVQIDSTHNYNRQSREAVYSFFARHVQGAKDPSVTEKKYRVEKPQDLLALQNRRLPDNALNYDGLLAQWIAAAKRQNDLSAPESFRERLRLALAAEWPAEVLSEKDGQRIVLGRAGKDDRVPGYWMPGKGSAALVVDPQGSEAGRDTPEARECIHSGRPLLAIDAYQTGRAVESRKAPGKQYLVFNKSDAANRVQDILTGLKFLSHGGSGPVTLIGYGDAGIWCVFAAAVAESPVEVKVDLASFHGEDSDFIQRFFVPAIQRAGGLQAALSLAKPSPLHSASAATAR